MAQFLAPLINEQQIDANGDPLVGGLIEAYLAGSSTPATTYSDKAGLVPNAWPLVLNTLGVNEQGAVWITGGSLYKFVIKDSAGVTQRTIDNISGVNDSTVSIDQWIVYQAPPTYISATSFSVAGDQTGVFQVGRRIKTQNTGGLVYSTITASAYSAPNTTVTVANDSSALDAGLSQVSYGILSANETSMPIFARQQRFTANGNFTVPAGVTVGFLSACAGGAGGAGGGGAINADGVGSGGAGGGAGQSVIRSPVALVPGQVIAVTIGAGGSGGTAGSPSADGGAGSAGGNTVFGALATLLAGAASNGGGSFVSPLAVPAGGTSSTGYPSGSSGCDGATGFNGGVGAGGGGASGPFGGGGGAGRAGSFGVAGTAAYGFGAGGGGGGGGYGTSGGGANGGVGGNGAPGIVIIEW